ncbi:MAG: hypothetical protein IPF92_02275 [Myxococcales bacterium]|nr:hypothetical protein [Myxococcales bacterium]
MLPFGWFVLARIAACAAPPPPPEAPPPPADVRPPPTDWSKVPLTPAPTPAPPSTASYEEAIREPEPTGPRDDRLQLTDPQLTGPMNGVLARCSVPSHAKVTIRTAVRNGRAIGVTATVAFEHKPRGVSSATLRYEAGLSRKIVACAEKSVRALTWPPSQRRDTFTTVF